MTWALLFLYSQKTVKGFLPIGFFIAVSAFGIETRELDILTESGDKNQAIERAVNQVSRDFVKHLMGEEKYLKQKKQIEEKIIKNRNRYILSAKTSAPEVQEEGDYLTTVTLGVSEENLKALLLENNLFYSSAGAGCILPVVAFQMSNDKGKEKFSWWKREKSGEADSLLLSLSRIFYSRLSEDFIEKGFYVMDPMFSRLSESVPSSVLPGRNSTRQFQKLSGFLNCDLILSGTFHIERDKTLSAFRSEVSLKVFNMKTLRELFHLEKKFTLSASEKGMEVSFRDSLDMLFTSLKYQLSFYRDRGVLDLSRLFLSVQGPLTYFEKERLKQALVQHISPIKDLKEAWMASNRLMYEVESSKSMKDLARAIRSQEIPGFKVQITGYSEKKLDIYAAKKL